MSATSTINFPQIRQDHDLRTTVERYLGPPDKGKWLCPFHKEKTPSFALVGDEKDHFKCYGCGAWGDVVNFISRLDQMSIFETTQKLGDGYLLDTGLSKDEFQKRQQAIKEWQAQETERKRQEQHNTLEWLRGSGRAEMYYHQMNDRSWWYAKGLDNPTIDFFQFGYTPQCPTYPKSPSYTIPIYYQGELYGIRHRLTLPDDKGGKYRPEIAGLAPAMFNADALRNESEWMTVLVEGEIKAAVLKQHGFNAVGIPGATNFKEKWLNLFSDSQIIYVALDPGVEEQALNIARLIRGRNIQVRLCSFPVKPDDFFVLYDGKPKDFMRFLRLGEKL